MNLASIQKYRGGLAPPTNPISAVFDVAIPLAGVIGKRLEEDQSVTPAERAALVKYQRQVKLQKYLKDKEAADIKGGKTVEWLDRAARDLVGLDPLHEHQYADLAKTDLVADYDPSQDEYVKSLSTNKMYQKRIMAQKRSQEARTGKGKPPIVIPMKEFVAEHKKLIPILKKGTKAEQVKEALDQEAELKMKGKGKPKKVKQGWDKLTLTFLRELARHYNLETKITGVSKLKREALLTELKKHLEMAEDGMSVKHKINKSVIEFEIEDVEAAPKKARKDTPTETVAKQMNAKIEEIKRKAAEAEAEKKAAEKKAVEAEAEKKAAEKKAAEVEAEKKAAEKKAKAAEKKKSVKKKPVKNEKMVKNIATSKFDDLVYYSDRYTDFPEAYVIRDGKVMIIGTVEDYGDVRRFDELKPVASNVRFYFDSKGERPIKTLNDLM